MNSPNTTPAQIFTKLLLFIVFTLATSYASAWEIDFSRRRSNQKKSEPTSVEAYEARSPAAAPAHDGNASDSGEGYREASPVASGKSILDSILVKSVPQTEIVILNTEKGFVPKHMTMKVGNRYALHIVNINEKERNVSFVLDAFNSFTSTFYGQQKTIVVEPKKEGVFSYQCPETAIEGRLVVVGGAGPADAAPIRAPAGLLQDR